MLGGSLLQSRPEHWIGGDAAANDQMLGPILLHRTYAFGNQHVDHSGLKRGTYICLGLQVELDGGGIDGLGRLAFLARWGGAIAYRTAVFRPLKLN